MVTKNSKEQTKPFVSLDSVTESFHNQDENPVFWHSRIQISTHKLWSSAAVGDFYHHKVTVEHVAEKRC